MRSVRHYQACIECTKKCLMIHGKKRSSSSPSSSPPCTPNPASFFKVMIGHFDKAMLVPPKFAKNLGGLVNQDIYLEDSNGNNWKLKLSMMNGSLAFEQGWSDFVLDHSITVGEIVIFKHISISHFSVQIYGKSGSERVDFHEKRTTKDCKRKRNDEIRTDDLSFGKDHKSSEGSHEKHYAIDENSLKKVGGRKPFPSDLAGGKMAVIKCDVDNHGPVRSNALTTNCSNAPCDMMGGDIVRVEEEEAGRISHIDLCNDEDEDIMIMTTDDSVPCPDKSGSLQNTSPVDYQKLSKGSQAACRSTSRSLLSKGTRTSIIHEDSVHEQEVLEIPPIDSMDPETFQSKGHSQDTERILVHEGNIDEPCDSVKLSKTGEPSDFAKFDNKKVRWAIVPCPLTEERMPRAGLSQGQDTADKDQMRNQEIHMIKESEPGRFSPKLDDEELVDNVEPQSAHTSSVEDKERKLNTSKKVGNRHLCIKGEISSVVDEDLTEKHEQNRNALSDLTTERDCIVSDVDKDGIARKNSSLPEKNLEVLSNVPILGCTMVDKGSSIPSCKGISDRNHSDGNLGDPVYPATGEDKCPQDRDVRSSTSNMIDMPKFRKCPDGMERDSCQPGAVSDECPEVDAEKVTSHVKEVLELVKIENIGSTDLPLACCASFRITISVISQSWLLLPERLPSRLLKKRNERAVVVLRDPSMRLWPVLYHEGLSFIGFIAGWEALAIANNLQNGVTCEIESASGSEAIFQVQISRA